ncbi:superoxide dismutase family protein [Parvularcula maris]|uniref:Superoxide dismutase family protein n=1 Tax=Parvularcula maris TaxID=2965077 RepID=A0A9X2L950_9PROT|nr:superoxide dismutase family protein [Parvularcula maris]MCQ8185350.1 superoxide dismutase family protein [Parvularcula maris]
MRKPLVLSAILPVLIACGGGESDAASGSQEVPEVVLEGPQTSPEGETRSQEFTPPPVAPDEMQTADIVGTDGEVIGQAELRAGANGMVIRLDASGIPEGYHGVHLHQVGDCSDAAEGFKASGSHINIDDNVHGLLNRQGYHTGADFPNSYAGAEGLRAEIFAGGLLLDQARDEDGFALIIHENEDDHITQPIGGAGGRIACAAFD